MSSFTNPLKVENVDAKRWKLIEEFDYFIGDVDSNEYVSVPVGTVTDFASIPRILWNILPPWGQYGKAAVIHDYMYGAHQISQKQEDGSIKQVEIERKQADDIFLEAMKVLGVGTITRYAMYYAVRVFGHRPWAD